MSKYIIELGDSAKKVVAIYLDEGAVWTGVQVVEDLEILNSDYINEHFGELQDTAYQRGLEDGKWKSEDGCTGCKYEGKTGEHLPCEYCMNNFRSQWTAKGDKIEVGDEVNWLGTCFIVTRIFQPHNMKEQCDGIDDDGCVYQYVLMDDLEKTGRHYNITKILEDMRND